MLIVLSARGHDCVVARGTVLPTDVKGVVTEVADVKAHVKSLFDSGMKLYENVGVGEKIELGTPLTWKELMDLPTIDVEARPMVAMHPMAGG